MRYLSLFSGIGGFEMGIPTDWKSVGFSELNKYASSIYRLHYPNHKELGDATRIRTRDLDDFEILVGGFPCQAFSIAGQRKGFQDHRGTLFFEIARILSDKRPRYFLLENVPNLLGHDNGKTFCEILRICAEIGYDVQWDVLNSKDFGVPQQRKRVFLIGSIREGRRPEIFPLSGTDFIFDESQQQRFSWTYESQKKQRKGNSHDTTIPNAQNGQNGQLRRRGINQINNPVHSNDRVYDESGLSPTLNTMQGGRRQPFIQMETANTLDCDAYLRTGARPRDENGKPQLKPIGERRIRRLTPTECERLQGFPDGYTTYGIDENKNRTNISDTQRYKCLGNAVTTNVVRAVTQKMEFQIEN